MSGQSERDRRHIKFTGGIFVVKGYKVFNHDWTCQGFQYEVGKTYEIEGELRICKNGFHFCKKASDCFNYYGFSPNNKVAEIIAHGDIAEREDKCCTSKIEIVREILWQEVLTIVNEGRDNTGSCNTGDLNTGNRNTGDRNTGDWNTGDRNTGDRNTGKYNIGDRNTGDWNVGDRNIGDRNIGYYNVGDRNTGDWNTGNWNVGDRNTGDWNSANYSSGVFCTEPQKILIFDKPSDWTLGYWRGSDARYLLNQIQTVFWVDSSDMTAQEKELHPECEVTGGFLKTVHLVEAAEKWWSELSNKEKQIIRDIPNFDADKFYKITGIRA
jgi:hypothetical protein